MSHTAFVITVSDSSFRGEREDRSGPAVAKFLSEHAFSVQGAMTVPDEEEQIKQALLKGCETADLVITTGGTGIAARDVTPEAVKPLFRREMDGFSILFHQASFGTVGFSTLQSRAFAGQIEDTFLFCLPGSTGACRDGWDLVLSQELDSRYRPCSLAGQIPRLRHLCA